MKPRDENAFDRTIILGNTASGKSWLSQQIGQALALPVVDLDSIRWIGAHFEAKQTVAIATAQTVEAAGLDRWVIEGVYGWLITPIIDRATCLIWTDLPWETCLRNLTQRETARGVHGNMADLEPWARDYWTRYSTSSYMGHLDIYTRFEGPKYRLTETRQVSDFVGDVVQGVGQGPPRTV